MQRLKIVVVGTSSAARILKCLANLDVEVQLVLAPDKKPGQMNSLHDMARSLGFPTDSAVRVKDRALCDQIRGMETDLLLCARSPFIFPPDLISAPSLGTINIHTGPLPEYAGRNVISWAIFNQRKIHGVTLHWMDAEIDTGPIAYQQRFAIGPTDTGVTVTKHCMNHACKLVGDFIRQAASDPTRLPRQDQDLATREYFGRENPNDGWLDFVWPAGKAAAFVRACDFFPFESPWGIAKTGYAGKRLQILRATETDKPAESPPGTLEAVHADYVEVACSDYTLRVTEFCQDNERIGIPEDLRLGGRFTCPGD